MDQTQPRLEQVDSIWVDGLPLEFQAAALLRLDELDPSRAWQMLIARPVIEDASQDFAIRITTRDGVTYSSRAKVSSARLRPPPGVAASLIVEGLQPLRVWHQA